jgi:hypothetical protein
MVPLSGPQVKRAGWTRLRRKRGSAKFNSQACRSPLALKVQECLQLCQHELHAHGRHDKLHETGNHSLRAATETRPQPNSKEQGRRDFCYTVHGNASKFRGIPPRPTLIWRKVPDWGTDMLFVFGCDLAATIGAF